MYYMYVVAYSIILIMLTDVLVNIKNSSVVEKEIEKKRRFYYYNAITTETQEDTS